MDVLKLVCDVTNKIVLIRLSLEDKTDEQIRNDISILGLHLEKLRDKMTDPCDISRIDTLAKSTTDVLEKREHINFRKLAYECLIGIQGNLASFEQKFSYERI